MRGARLSREEVAGILAEGRYFRLGEYALRDELYEKIVRTFLDGVEALAGLPCRDAVARDGLKNLHRHFPIAKIHRLESYLMRELKDDLYYWSYRVGADTLGLPDPFYVVHLIVFRIHYPYLLARKARDIEAAPVVLSDRLRLAAAALRDWRALRSYVARRGAASKARSGRGTRFDPVAYHGAIPLAARSHGPHVDTWYGHSYDGINLWLSIDGVSVDNTVILYPEMFGRPLPFDPVSMYLAPGVALSPPHKIDLKPGELLVFNPETLHGTQVNISDETRIAITTRINPGPPRYAVEAPFHFEHWYASDDLRRRKFSKVKMFIASAHRGEPSFRERMPYDNKTVRLRRDDRVEIGVPLAVCRTTDLRPGEKLAVDLANAKLLLWRDGARPRAFVRQCPHLGVDIADGSHDEKQIFCPGHGIAFSLADGASKCAAFRLRQFGAWEAGGLIYVEQRRGQGAEAASAGHPLPDAEA